MVTRDFTNGDILENVTASAVKTMTFSSAIDVTSIGKMMFLELTTSSNISGLATTLWTNTTNGVFNSSVSAAPSIDCIPAGYHEFPPDAFTNEQRGHGALVLHMCFVIYMFVALAIVCDEYFVTSLDKMCEKLGVSEDVAGATFMAAGSSAPELFTSMIGVFVTKGDVGVGTIVGSAVFNILFVIGLCGLLAGKLKRGEACVEEIGILVTKVVPLAWWPLCRDSLFYSLSIIILILVVYDGTVTWYESLIMLLFYALYIVIMRYNRKIQSWVVEKIKKVRPGDSMEINGSVLHQVGNRFHGDYEAFNNDEDDVFSDVPAPRSTPFITLFDYVNNVKIKLSMQEACLLFMMRPPFRITTRFRAAVRLAISYKQRMRKDTTYLRRQMFKGTAQKSSVVSYTKSVRNWFSRTYEGDNYESWMEIPDKTEGYINLFKWVTTYPIRGILYLTVPDSRKKRYDKVAADKVLRSIITSLVQFIMSGGIFCPVKSSS